VTTRMESLRRCRCDADNDDDPSWCGNQATQEDGFCDFCRAACKSEGAQALSPEEVLIRDGVVSPDSV